jgi:integrase/recombinase XerD
MNPMLTLYRRHVPTCAHRAKGRAFTRCDCPIWCDGNLGGHRVNRSLDTRQWKVADQRVSEWEAFGVAAPSRRQPTVAEACDAFLSDAESRSLSAATIRKYAALSRRLCDFAATRGIIHASEITIAALRDFRSEWKLAASTHGKELERLRALMQFWVEAEWIRGNPAKALKAPRADSAPTLPYSPEEIAAIVAAVDLLPVLEPIMRERTRVLLWTLRYTGLRISDAVELRASQIDGEGRLLLRQAKTGVAVRLPIPGWLVERLRGIEQPNGYYFKAGAARRDVDAGNWRRRCATLGNLAGLGPVRFHRFRDSFSVALLEAGVALETVSQLLGHSSIRITERHYAPWVRVRQVRLEEALRAADFGQPPATPLLQSKNKERKH